MCYKLINIKLDHRTGKRVGRVDFINAYTVKFGFGSSVEQTGLIRMHGRCRDGVILVTVECILNRIVL